MYAANQNEIASEEIRLIRRAESFKNEASALLSSGIGRLNDRLLEDQETFFSPFSQTNLIFVFAKNSLVCLNTNVQKIQNKIDELDQEDNDDDIDLSLFFSPKHESYECNLFHNFVPLMKIGMFRDLSILQMTRALEYAILPQVSFKTAKSLVKNVKNSAVRKSYRYGTGFTASRKLFLTTMKSQSLLYTAVFGFNAVFGIHSFVTHYETAGLTKAQQHLEIGRIIGFELVQSIKSWLATCIGAVIGSAIYPGWFTLITMNLAPLVLVPLLDHGLANMQKRIKSEKK